MSIDDVDKFERKEMEKKRPIKSTWYEWLINYIPELIRKTVNRFEDKVLSLFETSTPKDYGEKTMYSRGKKPSKPKTQNQFEENIIKSIRNLFKLKRETKTIKDRIIRDVRALFEQENDYYKPIRVGNFWNNNYIVCESNGDKNKKNTLMKLNPT